MELKKECVLENIRKSIVELKRGDVISSVKKALDLKTDPLDIVDYMTKGMMDVGEKYENGEYFLMELILAGSAAKEVLNLIKPHLSSAHTLQRGTVVIGTVQGDLHDIGKNLVIAMLSSAGYAVTDLGVDVPAEKFVNFVREKKPDIVALSALLTVTMNQMKVIIDKLKEAGLRDSVKIMVGGRPITQEFADVIGADAYGRNAVDAIKIARQLLENY